MSPIQKNENWRRGGQLAWYVFHPKDNPSSTMMANITIIIGYKRRNILCSGRRSKINR